MPRPSRRTPQRIAELLPAELDALLATNFERIEDAAVDDSIPVFSGRERWQLWQRR